MIIVIGHIIALPETVADVLALGRAHSVRSRGEPGCIAHNVHVDAEDAMRIVFVEYWSDRAALETHFALAESRAFVKAVRALSPAPTVMKLFEAAEIRIG